MPFTKHIRPLRGFYAAFTCVALAAPVLARDYPSDDEMVIKVICDFYEVFSDKSAKPMSRNDVRVFGSTAPIPKIPGGRQTHELEGFDGTRHFVMPDVGYPLLSIFITVSKSGESVRTTHFATSDGISVTVNKGRCEVIEQ